MSHRRCMRPVLLLLVLLAWLGGGAMLQLTAAAKPVELSSSAILFYNSEFQPMYGSSVSQCELLVRRAAVHGGRRIQFVPSHYWYDANDAKQKPDTCYPDNWADTNLKVDYFCSKFEWNSKCEPFNASSIATFRSGMAACMAVALQLFDEVLIAPHLDAAVSNSRRSKWRNMLRFDPTRKDPYGHSYYDLMLLPLLEAANEAFTDPSKTLNLAMGGEMGGTLLAFPGKYIWIMRQLRAAWRSPSRLRLGVTFYHAYTPGQLIHGPGPVGPAPDSPMAKFDGGYGALLLPFEAWPGVEALRKVLPNVRELLKQAEFVGVSNYARAPASPQPSDMESSTAKLLAEFQAMGIDLKQMLLNPNKLLIWNEFALGGGVGSCGDMPGNDSAIGLFPWLGITSSYEPRLDPFKQSATARAYVLHYYNSALSLLQAGAGKFRVDQAYIWNCGSWDVQGIHPSSAKWNTSVVQGSWPVDHGFAVQSVIDAIKAHNAKINGRSALAGRHRR